MMVPGRSEHGNVSDVWQDGHGPSVGSEVLDRCSRVRKAASSLQMKSEEREVTNCGTAKDATLAMLGVLIIWLAAPPASSVIIMRLLAVGVEASMTITSSRIGGSDGTAARNAPTSSSATAGITSSFLPWRKVWGVSSVNE